MTDKQGRYQGAGPLPKDFDKFESIDISREPIDRNAKHSGTSILRGPAGAAQGRPPAPECPGRLSSSSSPSSRPQQQSQQQP